MPTAVAVCMLRAGRHETPQRSGHCMDTMLGSVLLAADSLT